MRIRNGRILTPAGELRGQELVVADGRIAALRYPVKMAARFSMRRAVACARAD